MDKIFYNQASAAKLGWTPEWFGAYEFNEELSNGSEISFSKASIHSIFNVIWASPEKIKSINCFSKDKE